MISRRLRPTLVVLIVSLAVAAGSALMIKRSPVAVSFPVTLQPGTSRSPVFRPDYSGLHIVSLAADPSDGKRANCVLGGETPGKGPACEAKPPVALVWTIFANDKPVARGGTESPDRTWQTTYQGEGGVTREVGGLELKQGKAYVLEVRSLVDGRSLAPIHPRIRVQAHPSVAKGGKVIRSLLFSISVVVAAFAALRLAVHIWRNVRDA